jgi:hypothetical protein
VAAISFDDTNGNGITRDAALDSGDVFDARAKNTNYGGTGGGNITLVYYQGTGSAARKVGSTGGHGFTVGNYTSRDRSAAAYRVVIPKMWITNYTAINPAGLDFGIGSGTGGGIGNDQHWWTVGDDGTIEAPGFAMPETGGFVIKPIDTYLKAFRRGTSGTPTQTAMVNFMAWVDLSSTAGTDRNLAIDSPDSVETGYHMVGGDGGDADGTFQDFVDEDEGSGSTNLSRVGLWRTVEGVIYWFGGNEIGITYGGTATATEFTDEVPGTLVCPGGYVDEGFNVLTFDITNASSVMSLANKTFDSTGRGKEKLLFDAELEAGTGGGDVDTTLDEINYVGHGLFTGEQIEYSIEAGTLYNGSGDVPASGITGGESEFVTGTTGPFYYVINVSADVFAVASSFANALAGTRVALSAQTGTQSFQRSPCTLPDLIVTSDAAPGSWDFASGNIVNYNNVTLGNEAEVADTNVVACHKLNLNDGKLTRCSVSTTRTWDGEAFLIMDTPNATSVADGAIQGTSFSSGTHGGHAIEVTATGTYVWDGNTFSGYGDTSVFDGSDTLSVVDLSGDDITITGHSFSDGDAVEYYDGGGTAIVGLTNGRRYYINSVDANTVSLHVTREEAIDDDSRVNMTGAGVGTTHYLQSMNCAVYNSSGGAVTLQVSNGDTPSIRNSDGSTTTIENSVTIEANGMSEGAAVKVVARESAGSVASGDTLGEGLADSSGVFQFSLDYEAGFGAGLDVVVRAAQNGLPNAAVADDGGSQTDETTAANSTTDDDMTLTPDTTQAVNDAYYLGHSEQFVDGPNGTIRFKLEVTTAHGAGNPTITWEFFNGLSWASLTFTDADPNANLTSTGEFIYEFNAEGSWSTTTVNGQGPFYYVRARVSVAGTSTNGANGRFATLDVTKYFRQDLNREITASGLVTTVPWNVNTLAKFDPLND